jgi:hypothetical protein
MPCRSVGLRQSPSLISPPVGSPAAAPPRGHVASRVACGCCSIQVQRGKYRPDHMESACLGAGIGREVLLWLLYTVQGHEDYHVSIQIAQHKHAFARLQPSAFPVAATMVHRLSVLMCILTNTFSRSMYPGSCTSAASLQAAYRGGLARQHSSQYSATRPGHDGRAQSICQPLFPVRGLPAALLQGMLRLTAGCCGTGLDITCWHV